MVETNVFGDVAGKFADKIFSGILWFGIAIFIIGVLCFCMWWFLIYKKKFNIDVKIISERAEDQNRILFDKAAILSSRKDGTKYFKLWKTNIELPAPRFNIMQSTGSGDYIELYRTAEDVFYFLTPPGINKKYVIRGDGKMYPMAGQEVKQIDPDMAFWAAKRKGQNKGMFDTEKLWMKILPYIPHIITGVLVVFILYILMSHLPGILSQLSELARSMNEANQAQVTTVTG
jgi:hypothetical protein